MGLIPKQRTIPCLLFLAILFCSLLSAQAQIPEAAWRRPIGQPLENPGAHQPEVWGFMIDDGIWQGAPVGGIGAGTFSRSYRGNFERWHVKAGIHKYQNVPANQFAVFEQAEGEPAIAQALSTQKPEGNALSAWNWSFPVGAGEYAALYPKSWFAYRSAQLPVKLTVEQFSPILPNNYRETSYPVAVYNWYAENPTDKTVTVSVLFSWTNMVGWFRDRRLDFSAALNHQNTNRHQSEKLADGMMEGIVFDRLRASPVTEDWDGQFAIAALAGDGVEITHLATFNPTGDGGDVWKPFSKDGRLPNEAPDRASAQEPFAGAIAVRFTMRPGEKRVVPMALAWDMPVVQFAGGRKWLRRYTRFFGNSGTNAWKIAKEALLHEREWSSQIDAWQKPYIEDQSKPLWYRGELFNELYILADGGTVWAREQGPPANPNHPSAKTSDSFSFLECFDYPMYGSLDVRFYGSFPLAKFWPEIEKQEIRQYADAVFESNPHNYLWGWTQRKGPLQYLPRMVPGAVAHDMGNPLEDPFVQVNQYTWQYAVKWKDLNSKYVLMVWRDYYVSGKTDREFLRYTYNSVKAAMKFLRQYDKDGDGVIENEAYPDQTYDNWPAMGESAYCGGLYLGALRATEEIARVVGDKAFADENAALFKKAQASYIKKLWNGTYFNYDVGSTYKDNILASQLAGQWYANLTGLGDLVPKEMRRSALQHVFEYNVMKFKNGQMGAINGMSAKGELLDGNESEREAWSGGTFGIASTMLSEGMREQAFTTAKGVYNVVWDEHGRGYWFRTPESWDHRGLFRASMYMRPAAIWAMEMVPSSSAQK